MKYSLDIFNFLEEISSLSYSIVFLYFFALITEKAFLSLLAILWNSAFIWVYLSLSPLLLASLLFSAICKASPDNHFAFLHFLFLGMVLVTAAYTVYITTSLDGKESACNAGDPGPGRSPGEENGNSLQYSCLGNSRDREVWWATVHRVARS